MVEGKLSFEDTYSFYVSHKARRMVFTQVFIGQDLERSRRFYLAMADFLVPDHDYGNFKSVGATTTECPEEFARERALQIFEKDLEVAKSFLSKGRNNLADLIEDEQGLELGYKMRLKNYQNGTKG